MGKPNTNPNLIELDVSQSIWERFFWVAPLVLIGTIESDGSHDLAPKHMAFPMGWENYFGFVCTPRHSTCGNIHRTGVFTVSYPKPSQVLVTSLAASPRIEQGGKPVIDYFDTFPARTIDGQFIQDGYLYFECLHYKTIEGFGENCLITGEITAAYADEDFIRNAEADDQETIHDAPLFAYLSPGRFATIDRSNAFPFPEAMKK